MKYVFAIFISILLSGCLAKQSPQTTYYELSTPKKRTQQVRQKKRRIYSRPKDKILKPLSNQKHHL
ncbi:hypothetical protein CFVLMG6570_09150 [Campylobacter fetus subsp. venerealis LMG 6570 = CCUG 33900]|nr:hypothetical protein CFVCCUG33900_08920 [Campylobacter fetus subsp. venerealis LMG 6570 = CCUG 33900]OCS30187.1 hypothetical protein CFVLMG6570_09150 [Campylobacter fetus subsp. venerealis LMG 6570 = CCUG 33900]